MSVDMRLIRTLGKRRRTRAAAAALVRRLDFWRAVEEAGIVLPKEYDDLREALGFTSSRNRPI